MASREFEPEIIDPDIDLHDPRQRAETWPHEWDVLVAAAVGGIIGAEARYGIAELAPHPSSGWPWSTLITNVVGSLLIGVVMVVLFEVVTPHRLARPFLGVGILGGFTTFSTFAVDVHRMLLAHRPLVALGYVAASLVGCFAAVVIAVPITRAAVPRRQPAE